MTKKIYLILPLMFLSIGVNGMERDHPLPEQIDIYTIENALFADDSNELKNLLDRGLDPNLKLTGRDTSLLATAAGFGALPQHVRGTYYSGPAKRAKEKVKVLLQRGASTENLNQQLEDFFRYINVFGDYFWFKKEIIDNSKRIILEALEELKNLPGDPSTGKTELHLAAIQNNIEQAKKLIESRVDVDARDFNGNTPLHEAAYYGNLEIVELLVKAKADIYAKDYKGMTPYQKAIYNRKERVANKLKEIVEDKECAICLEQFKVDDEITLTECKHSFHGRCLDRRHIQVCPLCRKKL